MNMGSLTTGCVGLFFIALEHERKLTVGTAEKLKPPERPLVEKDRPASAIGKGGGEGRRRGEGRTEARFGAHGSGLASAAQRRFLTSATRF